MIQVSITAKLKDFTILKGVPPPRRIDFLTAENSNF
jgi:hypothetical protein